MGVVRSAIIMGMGKRDGIMKAAATHTYTYTHRGVIRGVNSARAALGRFLTRMWDEYDNSPPVYISLSFSLKARGIDIHLNNSPSMMLSRPDSYSSVFQCIRERDPNHR